jgi:hypothetical protein
MSHGQDTCSFCGLAEGERDVGRTSLRVATGGTVQQHLHVEPEALANCLAGGGGGEKLVPSERSGAESRPLHGSVFPS